jgi:hypothetical protein
MPGPIAIEDLVLNYDPEIPEERVRSAGLAVVSKTSIGRLPAPTPWPAFNDTTIWAVRRSSIARLNPR